MCKICFKNKILFNQNLVQLRVFWTSRSFVTPECFYKQPLKRSRWFFTCITPKHTKKCGYLLTQQASSIFNDVTKFQLIFRRKNIVLGHSEFPLFATFLSRFYQKDSVVANVIMLMLLLFYIACCSRLFTICHFVSSAYTLDDL